MKQEKNAELEAQNEEGQIEVTDEILEGLSGGIHSRRRPRRRENQSDKPDSDDGSGGVTMTW